MNESSSYLQYLPPVLWSRESDPTQFLGRMLRIFEKILTGIPDDVALDGGRRAPYLPFEQTIDQLPWLFDPWRAPADFLPELARWLGLDLPAWSEYQQRRLIAAMASIYQRHGTKPALLEYLDTYAAYGQPRLAIDDGQAIFCARFTEQGAARLTPIAYSHTVEVGRQRVTALLHPGALCIDENGALIVVDQGDDRLGVPPAIWRLTSSGEIVYTGDPPLPKPLHSGKPLGVPTAVVVDATDAFVADVGTITGPGSRNAAIYRFPLAGGAPETLIERRWAVRPVGMVLDPARNLVVLDRGAHLPFGDPPVQADSPAQPQIVVVTRNNRSTTPHALKDVVEPSALTIDSQGRLIVADAGDQSSIRPASLARVDPGAGWRVTQLLADVPDDRNPLIFPTGLAFESDDVLLVCDVGVRWGSEDNDTLNRTVAEPAAIYRIDLAQSPPTITCVSRDRRLVTPAGIASDRQGHFMIADRGESRTLPLRDWRSQTYEFGIVMLFSHQRPTETESRDRLSKELIGEIEAHKPAESVGWPDY